MTQDSRSDISSITAEIDFFMEKGFQVAFGYFGLLVAALAAGMLGALASVDTALGQEPGVSLSALLLFLNALYLTVALGTLFAVLKRGLFLLKLDGDRHPGLVIRHRWERFVRLNDSHSSSRGVSDLSWNLDNYYMAPLLLAVTAVSVAATAFGASRATGWVAITAVGGGVLLHLLPAYAGFALYRINRILISEVTRPSE